MFDIYLTPAKDQFYKIPVHHVLIPGPDEILDLDENVKYVDLGLLKEFVCTPEEAILEQRAMWDATIQQAKKDWLKLHKLSQLSGKNQPISERELQETLSKAFAQMNTESDLKPGALDEVLSGEDQSEVVSTIVDMLKGILGDTVSEVPENAEELEAWAQDLHQRFFSKEIARKEKIRMAQMKRSVEDSIAQRLRERGVTPARDLKKK